MFGTSLVFVLKSLNNARARLDQNSGLGSEPISERKARLELACSHSQKARAALLVPTLVTTAAKKTIRVAKSRD